MAVHNNNTPLEDLPNEKWKPIPGYEGRYKASSAGRIKGTVNRCNKNCPHVLKQYTHPTGYLLVPLTVAQRTRWYRVHKLIMLTHEGIRPSGLQINHINGDKADNRFENLEYCTAKENTNHAHRLGLKKNFLVPPEKRARGVRNKSSKLTEDQVRTIKAQLASGQRPCDIARHYHVSSATILDIRAGRSWYYVNFTNSTY